MKFRIVFISTFLLLNFSCKNTPETPVAKPQDFDRKAYSDSLKIIENQTIKKDSLVEIKPGSLANQTENTSEKTDTIFFKIHNGKVKIDTVKKPKQRVVFQFDSDTANGFSAKISTRDSVANLRISQIIDSKGNSDGPFGREIDYKILEKGIHQIIVSESQMAGEPWGGKFTFELKLNW
jgi:hypothetical protein